MEETIYFDPNRHPSDTHKAFELFCKRFELRYNAQFVDPPRTAMNSAIQRWELPHPPTEENPRPKPTVDEFDAMKELWKNKDKVNKVFGMFSAPRLHSDWEIAETNEVTRTNAT